MWVELSHIPEADSWKESVTVCSHSSASSSIVSGSVESNRAGYPERSAIRPGLGCRSSHCEAGDHHPFLCGRPDQALAEFARTGGMELIVIGATGHGASHVMFGSVTTQLAGGCRIPIFVGPNPESS